MSSGVSRTAVGAYEGTGALRTIASDKVGFYPRRVTIYRIDTRQDVSEFVEGMADNSMLFTDGSTGIRSLVVTQAITPVAGGFTVGTDVGVNASGDSYRYVVEE